MPADLVLTNARVITMDPARPIARFVAIKREKIMAAGSPVDLEVFSGAGTRVIDCRGCTVLPGFNDAHLHLFSLARKLVSIDVSPAAVRSIVDIKEAIQRKARETPHGTWLSGTDYNEFYLADKRCPNRWDLDEAAPDHPVVLSHRSLHACVLNSRGLELAGIGPETPEPPGGRIERDLATGEPNGILVNMLAYIRQKVMPPLTPAELDDGFARLSRELLSRGVTSAQDATYRNDPARWKTVRGYIESGRLRSRVSMMAGPETRLQFQQAGMTTGAGDERLRLGAVKFLLDVQLGQEELNTMALECHQAGWQLAFHAVAESTVEAAVRALEYVDSYDTVIGRHHRIEHCGECPPHLMERVRRLGAVVVTQPSFIYHSGERYLATVAASQRSWLYRIESLLASGIIVAGSSDAPVSPPDPIVGIYAAVTRRAESGQILLPEEAVLPIQAMALYTVNAAYASFEDNIKGSISPGRLADLVVLNDDPTRVTPERIKDIRVIMTVVGGEVLWEE